jgi:hypothetical protein
MLAPNLHQSMRFKYNFLHYHNWIFRKKANREKTFQTNHNSRWCYILENLDYLFHLEPILASHWIRVARFFLIQYTKTGRNVPNDQKITQLPQNRTTKLQMDLKHTNIFHSKAHKIIPKIEIMVWKYTIWQPCIECAVFSYGVIEQILSFLKLCFFSNAPNNNAFYVLTTALQCI